MQWCGRLKQLFQLKSADFRLRSSTEVNLLLQISFPWWGIENRKHDCRPILRTNKNSLVNLSSTHAFSTVSASNIACSEHQTVTKLHSWIHLPTFSQSLILRCQKHPFRRIQVPNSRKAAVFFVILVRTPTCCRQKKNLRFLRPQNGLLLSKICVLRKITSPSKLFFCSQNHLSLRKIYVLLRKIAFPSQITFFFMNQLFPAQNQLSLRN